MSRIAVHYLGQKVGTLAEARGGIFFEYDAAFTSSGHELSPLRLPLGRGVLARETSATMRLPGLFEDSLPDAWGERLMLEWFRKRGTPPHDVTPLMMLSYVGHRGMGALAYEPELDATSVPGSVSLEALHEAALEMERAGPIDLEVLAEVGSSVGGKHPKALIGLPLGRSGDILSGAGLLPASHEAWLVKLDTT